MCSLGITMALATCKATAFNKSFMLVLSTVVPSPEHNLIIELFYFETVWKLQ
jgi:hypothetical protein